MSDPPDRPPFCPCPGLVHRVVFGADIGTTFSAVSLRRELFCEVHGVSVPKVTNGNKFPTVLGYDQTRNPPLRLIYPGKATDSEKQLKYFKLLVADPDTQHEFTEDDGHIDRMLRQCELVGSPAELLGACMGALLQLAKEHFCASIELNNTNTELHFVYGYPAIYENTHSLKILDEALGHSNIFADIPATNVRRVHEHRAGVRTAICQDNPELWDAQEGDCGDTILVADLGGITIDLSLHMFGLGAQLTDPTALGCRPSVPKGTLFLDIDFERLVKEKLDGACAGQMSDDRARVYADIMQAWDITMKPGFNTRMTDDQVRKFSSLDQGIVVGISVGEIRPLFDKAVERAAVTVFRFYSKCKDANISPNVIFLAGGLSQNHYVFHQIVARFRDAFPEDVHKHPSIVKPLGWSIVAPGAALEGIDRRQQYHLTRRARSKPTWF